MKLSVKKLKKIILLFIGAYLLVATVSIIYLANSSDVNKCAFLGGDYCDKVNSLRHEQWKEIIKMNEGSGYGIPTSPHPIVEASIKEKAFAFFLGPIFLLFNFWRVLIK